MPKIVDHDERRDLIARAACEVISRVPLDRITLREIANAAGWTTGAVTHYFADKGRYPFDLRSLVDDHYLRDLPIDPITKSKDTWVTVPAQMDDQDISLEPGIADLYSGADGYGMDGSAYASW